MRQKSSGFTIIELLIVVVVIGILAAIVLVTYNSVQARAEQAKVKQDISQLKKAITLARELAQEPLIVMDGNRAYGHGGAMVPCSKKPDGTDLATLPKTDNCWKAYLKTLDILSTISNVDVRHIVDPWGRPYAIAELENTLTSGECNDDSISVYTRPLHGYNRMPGTAQTIPMTGYGGCT